MKLIKIQLNIIKYPSETNHFPQTTLRLPFHFFQSPQPKCQRRNPTTHLDVPHQIVPLFPYRSIHFSNYLFSTFHCFFFLQSYQFPFRFKLNHFCFTERRKIIAVRKKLFSWLASMTQLFMISQRKQR
jgi:hypothetical protein